VKALLGGEVVEFPGMAGSNHVAGRGELTEVGPTMHGSARRNYPRANLPAQHDGWRRLGEYPCNVRRIARRALGA